MKIEKEKFLDFLHHYYIYASKISVKGDYASFAFTALGEYLVKEKKDNGVSRVVYNGDDLDEAILTYNQLIGG